MLQKYWAFAGVGLARARAEPAEHYARVLFLIVILGVFSSLWRAVAASGANVGGDPHTFVVTVKKNAGNGAGYVPAAGEHVNFTLTDTNGAANSVNLAASTCDDAGANTNAAGQCTIVLWRSASRRMPGGPL